MLLSEELSKGLTVGLKANPKIDEGPDDDKFFCDIGIGATSDGKNSFSTLTKEENNNMYLI